jgi:hypothetical protein
VIVKLRNLLRVLCVTFANSKIKTIVKNKRRKANSELQRNNQLSINTLLLTIFHRFFLITFILLLLLIFYFSRNRLHAAY